MRTSKKDKMIIANLLTDILGCYHLRIEGSVMEKTINLLAIYCHVKPETIEGWEHITFDSDKCCCCKNKEIL
jgi:hypothetical protein